MRETLTAPARQNATLSETGHRPWPLPKRHWLMGQSWLELLFAHWPVDLAAVRRHVPPPLVVETFDGAAWVGVTPFRVTGLRLTATPPLPGVSAFPELNARTYVTVGDKPGIWFFSLDAASRVAVAAARRFYRLPYFRARMSVERRDGTIAYASERRDDRGHEARFRADYRPLGPEAPAAPGSLEHFLTERYCLYTLDPEGRPLRADIHHPPWPLRPAEAEIETNTMAPPGLDLPAVDPLLHFSARQDVVIWNLEPADVTSRTGERTAPASA
ncbi:MAG TPA: DUF2071 domain-containing protein [Gaiellaceae bacterium]|nr:DUF2071 domain-containing protein [Gaiellaceae bacterium]